MRIFVGGLSWDTTDASLRAAFSNYGTVEIATVAIDRALQRSRGFGFVEMPNAPEALAAINGLNGSMLDGRTIGVTEARPAGERPAGERPGGFNRGSQPAPARPADDRPRREPPPRPFRVDSRAAFEPPPAPEADDRARRAGRRADDRARRSDEYDSDWDDGEPRRPRR